MWQLPVNTIMAAVISARRYSARPSPAVPTRTGWIVEGGGGRSTHQIIYTLVPTPNVVHELVKLVRESIKEVDKDFSKHADKCDCLSI